MPHLRPRAERDRSRGAQAALGARGHGRDAERHHGECPRPQRERGARRAVGEPRRKVRECPAGHLVHRASHHVRERRDARRQVRVREIPPLRASSAPRPPRRGRRGPSRRRRERLVLLGPHQLRVRARGLERHRGLSSGVPRRWLCLGRRARARGDDGVSARRGRSALRERRRRGGGLRLGLRVPLSVSPPPTRDVRRARRPGDRARSRRRDFLSRGHVLRCCS